MKRQSTKHQVDGLVMLLLFGVFAACVMAVLLTGAKTYQGLTERDQAAFDRRACVQYIATRVRQADAQDGIAVEPFGEVTALAVRDGEFITRVYCWDGWLMELYCYWDAAMEPQDGERVMALDGLEMTLEDGLFTARIGGRDTLCLSLRSGEGGLG